MLTSIKQIDLIIGKNEYLKRTKRKTLKLHNNNNNISILCDLIVELISFIGITTIDK
jgi:hypothetical protein